MNKHFNLVSSRWSAALFVNLSVRRLCTKRVQTVGMKWSHDVVYILWFYLRDEFKVGRELTTVQTVCSEYTEAALKKN